MLNKTRSHHQFLKTEARVIPGVGDYLPSFLVKEKKNIYDYLANYLILTLLSTTCSPCKGAFATLYQFLQINPRTNMVILLDTDAQRFQQVKEILPHSTNLFLVSEEKLRNYFQGVPWGMSLNAHGQILSSYSFDSLPWFEKIVYPVRELI